MCNAAHLAALGGNLGGITSWLLGLDGGKLAAQLHADVLVPVKGFKRCVDAANGYGEQVVVLAVVDPAAHEQHLAGVVCLPPPSSCSDKSSPG